ncbi:uncharacterized protein LOC111204121 [Brassica napus]|uniref:uncharacterized protein LOC111204121 n=1 Tax=Brassica napus TaxID=3708 RepID=UPI00207A6AF9|nr:uncharacterized protein LOC111204121 [Brassica napus]
MMSQPPHPLITSSFVSQGRRRLVLVNDALIKHCASLCSINTDEPEPDLTNERHRSLTNIQANNLLGTHDLNTRLRVGNSSVWFVILGGFHQEDLRSNRDFVSVLQLYVFLWFIFTKAGKIIYSEKGTMLAVELLKNHVVLLTWSCKQPLNGIPNSLDQISCQWRFLMKH